MDWCVIVFLSAVGFFLTSLQLFFLYCTVLVTLWVVEHDILHYCCLFVCLVGWLVNTNKQTLSCSKSAVILE
jgi:hypothetical protein